MTSHSDALIIPETVRVYYKNDQEMRGYSLVPFRDLLSGNTKEDVKLPELVRCEILQALKSGDATIQDSGGLTNGVVIVYKTGLCRQLRPFDLGLPDREVAHLQSRFLLGTYLGNQSLVAKPTFDRYAKLFFCASVYSGRDDRSAEVKHAQFPNLPLEFCQMSMPLLWTCFGIVMSCA